MSELLNHLNDRVLLCDGALGTSMLAQGLTPEDYDGHTNCIDILSFTRSDLVRAVHAQYFAAGADLAQTNTFGASPITLGEFGIAEVAFELNKRSVELVREAAEQFNGDGRQRFALGSIGPGAKLPSLGHIDCDSLENALVVQASGLIAGGVDAVLIETCQDPLQFQAAINAVKRARAQAATETPIFVQLTLEPAGTLLAGADLAAAATLLKSLDVDMIGLNCCTGPDSMREPVSWLGRHWPGLISAQPNAGLPDRVDGHAHYAMTPEQLALWQERFVVEDGANMVGGCCGTGPEHIAALDAMLKHLGGARARPAPVRRAVHWMPAL